MTLCLCVRSPIRWEAQKGQGNFVLLFYTLRETPPWPDDVLVFISSFAHLDEQSISVISFGTAAVETSTCWVLSSTIANRTIGHLGAVVHIPQPDHTPWGCPVPDLYDWGLPPLRTACTSRVPKILSTIFKGAIATLL